MPRPSIAWRFVTPAHIMSFKKLSREISMLETATKPAVAGDQGTSGRGTGEWRRPMVILAAVTAVAGALTFGTFVQADTGTVSAAPVPSGPISFADLAAKVSPAVVTISSAHKVEASGEDMPDLPFDFPKGSPFEEFFRQFREQQRHAQPDHVMALGSGFIVDPSGYVVTNNHVVEDATEIKVTLSTGQEYAAKLIGTDTKTDLAVLKINAPGRLPF